VPKSEPTRRVCLLVNPSAGGGRARRVAPRVQRRLTELGMAVERRDTRDLDDARRLAREAAMQGDTVAVLSGDGTIGAAADVLREIPGAVLGVLPGGRGNDLARVLEIPEDPVAACETIAHGGIRAMDVGEVRGAHEHGPGRAFVGIASVGFDSEANRIANRAPSWLGNLVYAYGAIRALLSWRPARFEIVLQPSGERRSLTGYTVGACNSRTYGGGMRAAPDALLDDGLFDVVVLERVGKPTFLIRLLPKVFSGTHVREPCVRVMRASEVTIAADRPFAMYADGDPIGDLPVLARVLPGAVQVLVPTDTTQPAFCSREVTANLEVPFNLQAAADSQATAETQTASPGQPAPSPQTSRVDATAAVSVDTQSS
jgi:YegS/Rv2252/BmrU family lipid kinase